MPFHVSNISNPSPSLTNARAVSVCRSGPQPECLNNELLNITDRDGGFWLFAATTIASLLRQRRSMMTAAEVQTLLSISRASMYRMIAAHTIPTKRFGTCIRFDPLELADWLESL
jgi:excisionase family DNA binding protein